MMTSTAFSIVWAEIYSNTLKPFCSPEKIFGQGKPSKEMTAPSVPPRTGTSFGVIPAIVTALFAVSKISGWSSIFLFIFQIVIINLYFKSTCAIVKIQI